MQSQLITAGIAISDSGSQSQRIFLSWSSNVNGQFDRNHERLLISSLPDSPGPVIIDDGIFVNGHQYPGFAGTFSDPKAHIGQSAETAYKAVDPIDVTNDVRQDGQVLIQLVDMAGYTYTASRLYLISVPRT